MEASKPKASLMFPSRLFEHLRQMGTVSAIREYGRSLEQ